MRHLNTETLARLVDRPPTPAEAAHLDTCDECAAELDALRRQTRTLGELPDPDPPADGWARLEAALTEHDLIDSADRRPRRRSGTLRIAASLVLFLLGGITGFVARGELPGIAPRSPIAAAADTPGDAVSADAAARLLERAEDDYVAALDRYVDAFDDPDTPDAVARLAALQGIVLTTREALRQAPADPVINGYHLTAVAQRDAMLERFAVHADDSWF